MKPKLALVEPSNIFRQVAPGRVSNDEMRSREYLTPAEIERLIKAAKEGRWSLRDATLIMVAYRHGLRAKEACELEWSQVEFGRSASLHVRRAKKGKPSVHPIRGDELRMLTALRKEYPDSAATSSPPSAARHLRRMRSIGWSRLSASALVSRCRCIFTCCGIPADISSPTTALIPERFRTGSGTSRSLTRPATRR
jgi:integrase